MFKIHCLNCGSSQGEGVRVRKSVPENVEPKRDGSLSDQLATEFRCEECDIIERVTRGVLPELESENFESFWADGDWRSISVQIDGEEIQYESIDEQFVENSHYLPEGLRGTSKVHHLHVHAVNPPTISKGNHDVKIGQFVDNEFVLSTIRYHDEMRRTLKFHRTIPNELPEPIDEPFAGSTQPQLPR